MKLGCFTHNSSPVYTTEYKYGWRVGLHSSALHAYPCELIERFVDDVQQHAHRLCTQDQGPCFLQHPWLHRPQELDAIPGPIYLTWYCWRNGAILKQPFLVRGASGKCRLLSLFCFIIKSAYKWPSPGGHKAVLSTSRVLPPPPPPEKPWITPCWWRMCQTRTS